MKKQYTVLFIVGSGRSGSTILDLAIGANNKCFSVGEIQNLHKEFIEDRWCTCRKTYSCCDVWSSLFLKVKKSKGIYGKFDLNIKFPAIKRISIFNYIYNILMDS